LKKPKWEQLRFLANCAILDSLVEEYDFSLSLDNLLMDVNLIPKLLVRDAKSSTSVDFLQTYKALIGSILLPRYKYEDYINGGQANYKKNKFLAELADLETVGDIKKRLLAEHQRQVQEISETKKLMSKNHVWISRIALPILSILLIAAVFFGGRMMLVDIPFRDSVIQANTAYINRDALGVQQALRDYDLSRLSVETRHILSRSYVATEALTEVQRENILLGLVQRTEPIIFDYWILLGRLEFSGAVEIAQRLGDDELLLFAYLKQEVVVRQDLTIPGEERAALLSYLVSNIERLNRERDEAARNLNP